jgi:hypothetical protein
MYFLDEISKKHSPLHDAKKWCAFLDELLSACNFTESLSILDNLPDWNAPVRESVVRILQGIEHVSPGTVREVQVLGERIVREVNLTSELADSLRVMKQSRDWLRSAEGGIREHYPRYRKVVKGNVLRVLRNFAVGFGLGLLKTKWGGTFADAVPQMARGFDNWSQKSDEAVAEEFQAVVNHFWQQLVMIQESYRQFAEKVALICNEEMARIIRKLDHWLSEAFRGDRVSPRALLAWQDSPLNPRNHVTPSVKDGIETAIRALAEDKSERTAVREAAPRLAKALIADLPEEAPDPSGADSSLSAQSKDRLLPGTQGSEHRPITHSQPLVESSRGSLYCAVSYNNHEIRAKAGLWTGQVTVTYDGRQVSSAKHTCHGYTHSFMVVEDSKTVQYTVIVSGILNYYFTVVRNGVTLFNDR